MLELSIRVLQSAANSSHSQGNDLRRWVLVLPCSCLAWFAINKKPLSLLVDAILLRYVMDLQIVFVRAKMMLVSVTQ